MLFDTLGPCPWSCNFGWCLAEGSESEISAVPTIMDDLYRYLILKLIGINYFNWN